MSAIHSIKSSHRYNWRCVLSKQRYVKLLLSLLGIVVLLLQPLTMWAGSKAVTPDFDYPKTVSKTALADLNAALKAGDGNKTIDALVRYSLAQGSISSDNMAAIVAKVDSVIARETRPDYRALLYSLKARIFASYRDQDAVYDRRNDAAQLSNDYSEWDRKQFDNCIDSLLRLALTDEAALKKCPVGQYGGVLKYDLQGSLYIPTLYEAITMWNRTYSNCETDKAAWGKAWLDYEKQQGNIPALMYCYWSANPYDESLGDVYERYKDSEYSGLLLAQCTWTGQYSQLTGYMNRFKGNSRYAGDIERKINSIERKNVFVDFGQEICSTDSVTVKVSSRNVNRATINLYRVPDAVLNSASFKKRQYSRPVSELKLVASKQVDIAGTVPFEGEAVVKFPPLPYGKYAVLPEFEAGGKTVADGDYNAMNLFIVSDLASFTLGQAGEKDRIFAVDLKTGAPRGGVAVKGNKGFSGTTASDGSLQVPNDIYTYTLSQGSDKYGSKANCVHFYYNDAVPAKTISGYTDLGIYRPGETVKFAAVVYETGGDLRQVIAGEKVKASLKDPNSKLVDSMWCTADEFGRIEGSFKIPADRMNGRWSIAFGGTSGHSSYGYVTVNVSEYKTPTFTVSFPDATDAYVRKQPVKITGKVETYSGMPVQGTKVELRLVAKSWSWWWRWNNDNDDDDDDVNDTTVMTDAQGVFTIEYPAHLFKENADAAGGKIGVDNWRSYQLTAQVTNVAGETHESSTNFIIGRHRGFTFASEELTLLNDKPVKMPATFNSTDENDKNVPCVYTLYDKARNRVVATGTFQSSDTTLDLTRVPSGQYKLEVEVIGDTATRARATVTLYRAADKVAPVADAAMWLPRPSSYVDSKNVAHVLIGISVPKSHIYYIAASRKRILGQGWLVMGMGMHDFKVQVPNEPDEDITFHFINFYNGEKNEEMFTLSSPVNRQQLTAKVVSFRDKLVPGNKEKWTFQLLDKDNKPVKGAMMLEMYDKALDDLASNHWSFSPSVYYPRMFAIDSYFNPWGVWTNYCSFTQAAKYATNHYQAPQLWLYDRDFFFIREVFLAGAAHGLYFGAAANELSEAVVVKDEAPLAARSMKRAPMAQAAAGSAPRSSLGQVKVRTADVKTALWRPLLVSDAQGNVAVEFEAPEYNSTWIVQGIAYNAGLLADKFSREVLTQKPVMVKSSVPRFLRQADKATLAATVQNATSQALACEAVIELFNPRTGQIYASRNFSPSIPAKGTSAVSIDWSVPDSVSFVGFRVKAAGGNYGDGEQVLIPVLSAVSPVIETKPFYIDPGIGHFTMSMPSQARSGARITLEYCDNPVWYCLTALPTIYSDNYHVASALAHSLYAQVLARGIAKSQPKVAEAINYWKQHSEDSVLVSMLAKNQDLKIGTLLASPWLAEADRQTLRMSRLDQLLDEERSRAEYRKIVDGLKDLQMSDGGWCWYRYPGCRSSLWTTQEVLEIIGELQHLGYINDDAAINTMVKKALRYYDRENLQLFKKQTKRDKRNYSGFASYVYVRTLFPGFKPDPDNAAMIKKCLSAMTTSWKHTDLGTKAFYAMALNRNGYHGVARNIIASIREFAITKPELGMYWDNLQVGWRYFDKVAVTSTILQAINEIDPQRQEIDLIRKWILLMKQSNDWGSSSLAADAVYSILSTGSQWLSQPGTPVITIDGKPVELGKLAGYLGYGRTTVAAAPGAKLEITRNTASPAWGAVYVQYNAPMTAVEGNAITELSIRKEYYTYGPDGKIHQADPARLHVGDKVQVRVVIKNNKDMDYVTVADDRGACFEPVDQLSGYRLADGVYYYIETKDSRTNLFFSDLPKGTHVIGYDVYVTSAGEYAAGIATVQCQYAPQLTAHSAGQLLKVQPRQ